MGLLSLVIGPGSLIPAMSAERPETGQISAESQALAAGLIVELAKPEVSETSISAIESQADVEIVETKDIGKDIEVVEFANPVDEATITDAVEAAEARPEIVSAEPNWFVYPAEINPDNPTANADTHWAEQFGLWDVNGGMAGGEYSINAPEMWRYTRGAGQIVAVLDTGILQQHPDLQGQWTTKEDGNLEGYDFVSFVNNGDDDGTDPDPTDPGDWCASPPSDSSWHGTAVSSLIAAKANEQGIVGAAPEVKILPVRVLGKCGGYTSDLVNAIKWAAGLYVPGFPMNTRPAKVINMSLSTPATENDQDCGPVLQGAIAAARSKGAVVVAARGNEASPNSTLPSICDGVIGVAASDDSGNRASYSNYGTTKGTDIAAPGGDSPSENLVWRASNTGGTTAVTNNWKLGAGTSFAAPLVSSAAALMLTREDDPKSIERALGEGQSATAVHTSSNCSSCGGGILNLSKVAGFQNVTPPVIVGVAESGKTLTARGAWVGGPQLTFTWKRSRVINGVLTEDSNWSYVTNGSDTSTYSLKRTDLSYRFKVNVAASKDVVGAVASPQTEDYVSANSGTVIPPRPSVTGTMKRGYYVHWGSSTLKSNWPALKTSTNPSGYTYSYRWYNNGKAISSKYGGTRYRYKLRSSDRYDRISVKVTATKPGWPTLSYTSPSRKVY